MWSSQGAQLAHNSMDSLPAEVKRHVAAVVSDISCVVEW
jgi:hypothetical protein